MAVHSKGKTPNSSMCVAAFLVVVMAAAAMADSEELEDVVFSTPTRGLVDSLIGGVVEGHIGISTGHGSHGHYPGGHYPGGHYPGGHYPGHYPGGHYPGGHYPGGHPPGGHYPGQGGHYPGGHYPGQGGHYPGGHYPGQGGHYPGQGGHYPGGHYPGQGGHYPGQGVCNVWCRGPNNKRYCCGRDATQGQVVRPGSCPAVRVSCPPIHFGVSRPSSCAHDGQCLSGTDKCCYDVCLGHQVCKPALSSLGR
ncbi:uncharacterized protein LOC134770969 isoform X1 [Penaeus indicus]|uniref:uncharacterized protein LOC134770969 isoform X1 n=1 Tax=Penaeus indicus TaxID=29960 RepID=UPI00300CC969